MDVFWGQVWLLIYTCTVFVSGQDPCENYTSMSMYNGRRSADYQTALRDIPICDYQKYDPKSWLRFDHETGNQLLEDCVATGRCGTDLTLWLNGTHPTGEGALTTTELCLSYRDDCCYWSTNITVQYCSGGDFYVYKVPTLPGCDMGFCMEPLNPCRDKPNGIWNYISGQCDYSDTNTKPSLNSGNIFWKPRDQKLETTIKTVDVDGDDVTVSLYYPAPDGVTLYYNGYFAVDASLNDDFNVTIQLTDSKKATNVYTLVVQQFDCPCEHNGTCKQEPPHSVDYTCFCAPGYFGSMCQSDNCTGHCDSGTCDNNRCICDQGYEGPNCDRTTTPTTTTTASPTTPRPPPTTPGLTTTRSPPVPGPTTTRSIPPKKDNSGPLIGGIIAACIIGAVILMIIFWLCTRKKSKQAPAMATKTSPAKAKLYSPTVTPGQITDTLNPAYQDVNIINVGGQYETIPVHAAWGPPPPYDGNGMQPYEGLQHEGQHVSKVDVGVYETLQGQGRY
mgnify:CR=1 FL=1